MQRAFSTLLTALLFSAAIVPSAMAQAQTSDFLVNVPGDSVAVPNSTAMPDQPVTPSAPAASNAEVLPEPSQNPASVSTIDSHRARPSVSRSSLRDSYPSYCPSLPAGTKPGDWEYREALERCLYGD